MAEGRSSAAIGRAEFGFWLVLSGSAPLGWQWRTTSFSSSVADSDLVREK